MQMQAAQAPDPAMAAQEAATIRPATPSEHSAVASALAKAFYDDPVLQWFFPDDARRLGQLERIFGFLGKRIWFVHDLTYTTDGVVGAAAWVPPEKWHTGMLEQLGMLPGMASAIGLRDLPRGLRGFNLMESKHPHEAHFYLPVVGVEPAWQGKGLGSALLQPLLQRCDREGASAYLEATTPRSRTCYERNGFEVTGEIVLPKGPTMWAMWRKPRAV